MTKNSSNPERLIFNTDRDDAIRLRAERPTPYVKDSRGWILFGPHDIRGASEHYMFCLQKLPNQKLPRVRAGCRYFTLKQAWRHWHKKAYHSDYTCARNEGKQAIALIRLLLLQAQAYGLLSIYAAPIVFDSTIVKPKRK